MSYTFKVKGIAKFKTIAREVGFVICYGMGLVGLNAQNYLLNFKGSGSSTTIDSVIVHNLNQGTQLKLLGNDTLQLAGKVGIKTNYNPSKTSFKIYPNPMIDNGMLILDAISNGEVNIELYNLSGSKIISYQNNLSSGHHTFKIEGLLSGFYNVYVSIDNKRYHLKLISQYYGLNNPVISFVNSSTDLDLRLHKKARKLVQMQYNDSDLLLMKAYSGANSTVSTLVPSASFALAFIFVSCIDGDGNSYSNVVIGAQTWMVENLKTTKFNNGSIIPYTPVAGDWINLKGPGYCWYNNDVGTYKDSIGGLYNWHTVGQGNVCPAGWRIPSDQDWNQLSNYLGGSSKAGGMMKDIGAKHWRTPNVGATNRSGFTAKSGRNRHWDGNFTDQSNPGLQIIWWSADDGGSSTYASTVQITHDQPSLFIGGNSPKNMGFYVRCIKN